MRIQGRENNELFMHSYEHSTGGFLMQPGFLCYRYWAILLILLCACDPTPSMPVPQGKLVSAEFQSFSEYRIELPRNEIERILAGLDQCPRYKKWVKVAFVGDLVVRSEVSSVRYGITKRPIRGLRCSTENSLVYIELPAGDYQRLLEETVLNWPPKGHTGTAPVVSRSAQSLKLAPNTQVIADDIVRAEFHCVQAETTALITGFVQAFWREIDWRRKAPVVSTPVVGAMDFIMRNDTCLSCKVYGFGEPVLSCTVAEKKTPLWGYIKQDFYCRLLEHALVGLDR